MKVNLKDKKVILGIAGVVVVVGIVSSALYSKVNTAQNDYVKIQSTLQNIKREALGRKTELLSLQENIMKLNEDKNTSIQIDEILSAIDKEDYRSESKINDNIAQLDTLNEEIDKMISIYNNSETMKKDMVITNAMMDIEGLESFIEGLMEEYNDEHLASFNKLVEKFPVSVVAKNKGWTKINEFSSIG